MTTAAIMQPTYLPWCGYFGLMNLVDIFVIYDDVQFDKRSWQQRNKIKTPAGSQWLTVPVASKGQQFQKINDVKIQDTNYIINNNDLVDGTIKVSVGKKKIGVIKI